MVIQIFSFVLRISGKGISLKRYASLGYIFSITRY